MDSFQKQKEVGELIKAYDKQSAAYDLALRQKSETDKEDTNRLTMLTQIMVRASNRMDDIRAELKELGHHVS